MIESLEKKVHSHELHKMQIVWLSQPEGKTTSLVKIHM
jgi:hypothetical protein